MRVSPLNYCWRLSYLSKKKKTPNVEGALDNLLLNFTKDNLKLWYQLAFFLVTHLYHFHVEFFIPHIWSVASRCMICIMFSIQASIITSTLPSFQLVICTSFYAALIGPSPLFFFFILSYVLYHDIITMSYIKNTHTRTLSDYVWFFLIFTQILSTCIIIVLHEIGSNFIWMEQTHM